MSERAFRFIGIDLSTKKIAIAVGVAPEAHELAVSWREVTAPGDYMADRFRGLVENFRSALEQMKPVDMAFIEDITFTRGRQTELGLAKVMGAVEAHLADCGITYLTVNNVTWKAALGLGSRKGAPAERKDRNVEHAQHFWGVSENIGHDVGDALCVLEWGMRQLHDPITGPKMMEQLGG